MDDDRAIVAGACLPNGIQFGVIHRHQLAVLVADTQAEGFVEFQSLGTRLEAFLQAGGLALSPIGGIDVVEID